METPKSITEVKPLFMSPIRSLKNSNVKENGKKCYISMENLIDENKQLKMELKAVIMENEYLKKKNIDFDKMKNELISKDKSNF